MLVCPQCQFHNPDTHKFCQQCGLPLTQKTCPQCGSLVAFHLETCWNCGHYTATTWWAILAHCDDAEPDPTAAQAERVTVQDTVKPVALAPDQPLAIAPESSPDEVPASAPDQPQAIAEISEVDWEKSTAPAAYLDAQERYQLLHPLMPFVLPPLAGELELRVLDTQPLLISPLEIYLDPLKQLAKSEDITQASVVLAGLQRQGWELPVTAAAYLALHLQFPQTVPKLHDAWGQAQQEVWLLEDRSSLVELSQIWQQETLTAQNLLYWLWEMLDLWIAFASWGCCQSLLKPGNLRLDQNQTLCLQRLHFAPEGLASEPLSAPVGARELGQFWQSLFQQGAALHQETFAPLLQGLETLPDPTVADLEMLLQQMNESLRSPEEAPEDDLEDADPTPVPEITEIALDPEPSGGDIPTAILPNQLLKLEAAGQTHSGRDRHQNEDYFIIQQRQTQIIESYSQNLHSQGLYILCDGMGGHAEGEVASALAASSLREFFATHWREEFPSEATLEQGIFSANQRIYNANEQQARSGHRRMGTTLVMALIQDLQVRVAHVGDSRLYRYSQSQGLEQVTVDHEVGQREVSRGVEPALAYARPDAYQLTQALGPRDDHSLFPEVQSFGIDEDTLLLLCSDGLTDNQFLELYGERDLAALLNFRTDLNQGIRELIDRADHYNGHDNITAIAIRMQVSPQGPSVG